MMLEKSLPDTHQNFSPVLLPLLGACVVHLSQLMGVEADKLWLDLLQQGLHLPLLPLLDAAVGVRVQAVEVRLSCTCECHQREAAVKTRAGRTDRPKVFGLLSDLQGHAVCQLDLERACWWNRLRVPPRGRPQRDRSAAPTLSHEPCEPCRVCWPECSTRPGTPAGTVFTRQWISRVQWRLRQSADVPLFFLRNTTESSSIQLHSIGQIPGCISWALVYRCFRIRFLKYIKSSTLISDPLFF